MIDKKSAGQIDGFEFELSIEYDPWATPEDDEGLTEKQIDAWKKDEWHFVYATVTAKKAGIELASASYGGLEYGFFPETDEHDNLISTKHITIEDIDTFVGSELCGEAQSRAEEKLAELMKGMQNA